MKLAKLNNQSSEYKELRNKVVFQIQGTEEQADLIEKLDGLIGAEIYGVDGNNKEITWYHEACDSCADYIYGAGCGWIVDKDDVEDFKALWKKYKKVV